ncbi:MAG: PIN domain-containing protein [Verrucomicrobia bacterium]|nr:PIN domain-containing protein [Verrucomicrobiota bacterium]
MNFWDTSAIGPLLWEEINSAVRLQQLEEDPWMVVWWTTPVEIESALTRRKLGNQLDESNEERVRNRLKALSDSWIEIEPSYLLRELAKRLIRVHGLRSADSLQLAAALIACGNRPSGHHFLTGDQALKTAAGKEGFKSS